MSKPGSPDQGQPDPEQLKSALIDTLTKMQRVCLQNGLSFAEIVRPFTEDTKRPSPPPPTGGPASPPASPSAPPMMKPPVP